MKEIFLIVSLVFTLAFSLASGAFALDNSRELYGDVDCDGVLTASDARLILRFSVGLDKLSGHSKKLADIDGDNEISASDARSALRTAVSLENELYYPEGLTYSDFSLDYVPGYDSDAYVVINNNEPMFEPSEITFTAFQNYSPLDESGRCGAAISLITPDIMPEDERGAISSVTPSGWIQKKYDVIPGKYLYNRCHLIGYQLTGQNANKFNLITGTRYLNIDGMLSFENEVAEYVKESGEGVLYRVTPYFYEDNLLASGVLMEGYSVADEGASVYFCVFCYNVQPGISIDYKTGDSSLASDAPIKPDTTDEKPEDEPGSPTGTLYVINTATDKFHSENCRLASKISEANRLEITCTRDELIAGGYSPCGICKP